MKRVLAFLLMCLICKPLTGPEYVPFAIDEYTRDLPGSVLIVQQNPIFIPIL